MSNIGVPNAFYDTLVRNDAYNEERYGARWGGTAIGFPLRVYA